MELEARRPARPDRTDRRRQGQLRHRRHAGARRARRDGRRVPQRRGRGEAAAAMSAPRVEALDLASQESVRAFAERWDGPSTCWSTTRGDDAAEYRQTEDGFELQYGTNHLGHFALTGLCAGPPVAKDPACHGSSIAHHAASDGPRATRRRRARRRGNSKLANLLFAGAGEGAIAAGPASRPAAHPDSATELVGPAGWAPTGGHGGALCADPVPVRAAPTRCGPRRGGHRPQWLRETRGPGSGRLPATTSSPAVWELSEQQTATWDLRLWAPVRSRASAAGAGRAASPWRSSRAGRGRPGCRAAPRSGGGPRCRPRAGGRPCGRS